MVDRLAGAIRVPAPTLAAYPQTLLSILEARGLLHDAPEGSHLQNGVWWESEAAIRGNDDVTYTEGSFSSEDKTIQHGIAVTTGFAFELSRYIQLGVAGGTQAEQEARAQRRFEAWESYDVARHIRTFLEANDTVVAGTYGPVDAVAALLAQVALVYQASPMVLSGRGPSVRLLKDSAVELAGGIYGVDSGFGIGDTTTGKVYATGTISVWRTPLAIYPVQTPSVNETEVLVERAYYVVIDGPIYSTTSEFADAVT
jgi:hypothetical protein